MAMAMATAMAVNMLMRRLHLTRKVAQRHCQWFRGITLLATQPIYDPIYSLL